MYLEQEKEKEKCMLVEKYCVDWSSPGTSSSQGSVGKFAKHPLVIIFFPMRAKHQTKCFWSIVHPGCECSADRAADCGFQEHKR
jgi:hypothetical protein